MAERIRSVLPAKSRSTANIRSMPIYPPQGLRQLVPYRQRRLRPLGQHPQHTGQRFPSRRQLQLWRPRSLDRDQPLFPSAGRAAVSRLRRTRCRIPIRAAQRRQDPDRRPVGSDALALGVFASLGLPNAGERQPPDRSDGRLFELRPERSRCLGGQAPRRVELLISSKRAKRFFVRKCGKTKR